MSQVIRQGRARTVIGSLLVAGVTLGMLCGVQLQAGGSAIPAPENSLWTVARAFDWSVFGCPAVATNSSGTLLESGVAVPITTNVTATDPGRSCSITSVRSLTPNVLISVASLPVTVPSGGTVELDAMVETTMFGPPATVSLQLVASA